MSNDKKKPRFRLFDITRDGKGVSKNLPELEPGLKKFFILFKNNFGRLVSVNIFFVLGNFPIFFLIFTLAGYTKAGVMLPSSDLFQNAFPFFSPAANPTPYSMTLFALEGLQREVLINTPTTYAFYGIAALTALTFGIVNVGTAYILRNIVKGEPIFMWSDFWYAVSRNWKQALPFGIVDSLIIVLLCYDIYYTVAATDFFLSFMFWSIVIISLLYFFMRYYIYIQMVTFDLSIRKILKNSFILALLGIKRNLLALLGIILVLVIELTLLLGTGGLLLPLAVAAPLTIILSLCAFMKVYAGYFKMKEIMIDPYYPSDRIETAYDSEEPEVVMRDDVTERERLLEIKRRNNIED